MRNREISDLAENLSYELKGIAAILNALALEPDSYCLKEALHFIALAIERGSEGAENILTLATRG